MTVIGGCSSKLFTQWRHLSICCMVAETISVICSEHSYQHSAPDLALMLCTCFCNISGSSARSYCGTTYNTSLCVVTEVFFNILIFFSETKSRWFSFMLDCHSLFKSACNSTYKLFGVTLKIVKFRKNNFKFSQI